jgi:mRNA-degrading endonuclease toxin of MazEF toxin-antitoxin module
MPSIFGAQIIGSLPRIPVMDDKPCAAKPKGKTKGLKVLLDQGALYAGRFTPVWGGDKKGRSTVLVLRDEGDQVFVAPVEAASKAKPSRLHIKVPRGQPLKYSGVVLLDRACEIDKQLLERKVGDLPDDILSAVTVAAFAAGRSKHS